MILGNYSNHNNQTKTQVNNFDISWPPSKHCTAVESSEWAEDHPTKHARTEDMIEEGTVLKYEAVSQQYIAEPESLDETTTPESPETPAAKTTRPKRAKKDTRSRSQQPRDLNQMQAPNRSLGFYPDQILQPA